MNERWLQFALHTYYNLQQREHIGHLRTQSALKIFVVAQMDFSMNYTLVRSQRSKSNRHVGEETSPACTED